MAASDTMQLSTSVLTGRPKKRSRGSGNSTSFLRYPGMGRFAATSSNQAAATGAVDRLIHEKIRGFGDFLGLPSVVWRRGRAAARAWCSVTRPDRPSQGQVDHARRDGI